MTQRIMHTQHAQACVFWTGLHPFWSQWHVRRWVDWALSHLWVKPCSWMLGAAQLGNAMWWSSGASLPPPKTLSTGLHIENHSTVIIMGRTMSWVARTGAPSQPPHHVLVLPRLQVWLWESSARALELGKVGAELWQCLCCLFVLLLLHAAEQLVLWHTNRRLALLGHQLNTETELWELVRNHQISHFLDNSVCFHKWRQSREMGRCQDCGLRCKGSSPCRMGCQDVRP